MAADARVWRSSKRADVRFGSGAEMLDTFSMATVNKYRRLIAAVGTDVEQQSVRSSYILSELNLPEDSGTYCVTRGLSILYRGRVLAGRRFRFCWWYPNCFITSGGVVMLYYSWIFLVIALIAALFGFGLVASAAAGIAKVLFFVFLVLFLISLITGRRAV